MACDIDNSSTLSDDSYSEVEETPHNKCINFLLLGTSGNGKSATGNSITLQSSFKTSDNVKSVRQGIEKCSSEFEDLVINVVEVPGNPSDDQSLESFEELQQLVEEAFHATNGGFAAIVFVLKYGNRFTEQECRMLKWIKGLFGDEVVKNNLICLLTHGDFFEYESEDEDKTNAFVSWCKQQDGKIKLMFQECSYRCVLFNNKTKDPAEANDQIKSLMKLTRKTKVYTNENFKNAEYFRQQSANQIRAPAIQREAQKKLNSFREILAKLESEEKKTLTDKVKEIEELLNQVDDLEKSKGLAELSRNMINMFKIEIMSQKKLIQSEARLQSLMKDNEIPESKGSMTVNSERRLSKGSADSEESEKPLMESSFDSEFDDKDIQTSINLLLLGTERNGKHLVKNIILGHSVEEHTLRSKRDVEKCSTEFQSLTINVYDFPDIDTDKEFVEDFDIFQNYTEEALRMCGGGFSALVLVLKYNGSRTYIDQQTLRLVKDTFGQNVFRNNIFCVITNGDKFENDNMGKSSLKDWCREQKGDLKKLFQECQYRCMLFNDKYKDQDEWAIQVKSFLALTEKVQIYTKNNLKDAFKVRKMSFQNLSISRGREIKFLYNILKGVLNSYTQDIDDQRKKINTLIEETRKHQYSGDPILRENDLINELLDVKRELDESYNRSMRSDSRHGLEFERNTRNRESNISSRPLLSDDREKKNVSDPANKTCCTCHIL